MLPTKEQALEELKVAGVRKKKDLSKWNFELCRY